MEWLSAINKTVSYIEDHLLTVEGVDEIAKNVFISPSYLQQGFQIMTDHSIAEYIRNRRLYQAAVDLIRTDMKIIDIAIKYGYETPASFTKAFGRFHNASPSEIRKGIKPPVSFLPIKVSITIRGGLNIEVEIVEKEAFKVIGMIDTFTMENCHEISKRWKSLSEQFRDLNVRKPKNALEKAIVDNRIGTCGVTGYPTSEPFTYVFGGIYLGGEVPEPLKLYEIPKGTWAVFNCVGKLPGAMEELNDLIWNNWVPGNNEYEVGGQCEFELYYEGDSYNDPDYLCTKWIPVKRIGKDDN